jgi:hypothetical protein
MGEYTLKFFMLNIAASLPLSMNFFIHGSLLAFSAGIFVISTVAAWKTGTY